MLALLPKKIMRNFQLIILILFVTLYLSGCAKKVDYEAGFNDIHESLEDIHARNLAEFEKIAEAERKRKEEELKNGYLARLKRTPFISKFGKRGKRMHYGLDIKGPTGAEVLAYDSGEITFVGRQRGYGLTIDITHKDGSKTRYAHMSKYRAKKGDKVWKGDVIGEVGNSGRSSTPHLHFEMITKKGTRINPGKHITKATQLINYNAKTITEEAILISLGYSKKKAKLMAQNTKKESNKTES